MNDIQEVSGSIPLISTTGSSSFIFLPAQIEWVFFVLYYIKLAVNCTFDRRIIPIFFTINCTIVCRNMGANISQTFRTFFSVDVQIIIYNYNLQAVTFSFLALKLYITPIINIPTCITFPSFITAILSETANASCWS